VSGLNAGPGDVTVVIPMYNAAPTIKRALESVMSQTTPPARIVVVDDLFDRRLGGRRARRGPPLRGVGWQLTGTAA